MSDDNTLQGHVDGNSHHVLNPIFQQHDVPMHRIKFVGQLMVGKNSFYFFFCCVRSPDLKCE